MNCRVKVIMYIRFITLTWYKQAAYEWITAESGFAHAYWTMVYDSTRRALTARVGTRINTLIIFASSICRTICANCTFGSTTGWCADISRQTRANSLAVTFSTLTIWSARGWLTGINVICYNRCKKVIFKIT